MAKVNRLTILFLLVFVVALGALFVTPSSVSAKAEINYVSTVEIRNGTNGYLYGNNDEYKEDDSLQDVFDEIVANATSVVKVSFVNVTTTEALEFDYERKIVLESGVVNYNGTINDTFITVKGGWLEMQGAQIYADVACTLKIESSAKLTMSSGSLTTSGAIIGKMQSTLHNEGECFIEGGIITYESDYDGNAGQAISQAGSNAKLKIAESGEQGSLVIKGKSALRISGGNAEISSGVIKATSNDGSVSNGIALGISNSAKVIVNGGLFESVNEERTITLAGNGQSSLTINGGSILGRIILKEGSGGNNTSLTIQGVKIISSDYGKVIVYTDEEYLTKDNARLGLIGSNGYYLTGWVGANTLNPLVSEFSNGATALAKASNLYEVSLVVDGVTYTKTLSYGYTIVDFSEFDIVVKEGYEIKGWEDSLGNHLTSSIVVGGEETYEAELALKKPTIAPIGDAIKAFNGKEVCLKGRDYVIEADSLTYEYVWKGRKGDVIGETLTLLKVNDSDVFILEVTVSDGISVKTASSNQFKVEINKGSYEGVTHPVISGTYDANRKLSSYSLNEGFKWKNLEVASEVPTVSKKEYEAIYCLDSANYNEYHLNITVDLEKAQAPEMEHVTLYSVYAPGKTLAEYQLGANWRWEDDSVVLQAGTQSYPAYYNPDEANYLDSKKEVTLIIEKAEYRAEDVENLSLTIPYKSGLTVQSVAGEYYSQMGYYSFASNVSSATKLNEIKTYEPFDGLYNADKNNYKDYACKIIITVVKSQVKINYNDDNLIIGGVYSPDQTIGRVTLKNGWRWLDASKELLSGENEYVIIYNPDPNFYLDYEISVTLKVSKATTQATHKAIIGVYSSEQTLADFTLDAGWSWVDGSETPTVNKEKYSAVYVRSVHYEPYYAEISLLLEKATIDMGTIKFENKTVTYDGREHDIAYTGEVPEGMAFREYSYSAPFVNAGSYECKAYFTQTDTDNYKQASKTIFTATLKINKANVDISGISFNGKEVVYDGHAHYLEYEGTLPSGISVEYFGNGQLNAGKHVVELKFNLFDSVNYNQIEPKTAVLTIVKASANIIANDRYVYAYDGEEHIPEVTINNSEQTISYDTSVSVKEIGEYSVKFFAQESANYKYVEKVVSIIINKTSVECGNVYKGEITALIGKITNLESGIDSNATLTMAITSLSNEEVAFDILLGGQAPEGNYTVNILIPDGMKGAVKVYVKNGESYEEIESVVSGNYIIFNVTKLGGYKLVATESWDIVNDKALEWWGWLLISLAIVIVIAGISVGLVFAYKKGKLPIEQLRKLFVIKKNATSNAEVEVVLGEENEE